MARRLNRYDIYLTKNFAVGDTRQIPAASINVDTYRQGATTNGTGSIAPAGSGDITVRHPGRISVGDTVFVGTASAVTATVNTVAETVINVTAGGSTFAWTDGARIRPLNARPSTFVESTGNVATASASRATTGSLGHAFLYAEEESLEAIWSLDGTTFDSLADWDGVGGNVYLSNEFDSVTAVGFLFKLRRALTTSGAKLLDILDSAGASKFSIDKDGKPTLPAGSVLLASLAADSVDASKIVDGTVGAAELATGAVTTPKLATAAAVKFQSAKNSADQAIATTTATDLTNLSIAVTPDGASSEIWIIGNITWTTAVTTARQITLEIKEDGVVIQTIKFTASGPVQAVDANIIAVRVAGFVGTKTYKLTWTSATADSTTVKGSAGYFSEMYAIEFKKAV